MQSLRFTAPIAMPSRRCDWDERVRNNGRQSKATTFRREFFPPAEQAQNRFRHRWPEALNAASPHLDVHSRLDPPAFPLQLTAALVRFSRWATARCDNCDGLHPFLI